MTHVASRNSSMLHSRKPAVCHLLRREDNHKEATPDVRPTEQHESSTLQREKQGIMTTLVYARPKAYDTGTQAVPLCQ